jgi:hypothetical protein
MDAKDLPCGRELMMMMMIYIYIYYIYLYYKNESLYICLSDTKQTRERQYIWVSMTSVQIDQSALLYSQPISDRSSCVNYLNFYQSSFTTINELDQSASSYSQPISDRSSCVNYLKFFQSSFTTINELDQSTR